MSYSDDTMAHMAGYPEPQPVGATEFKHWRVTQRMNPGVTVNWFTNHFDARRFADTLDGTVTVDGVSCHDYELTWPESWRIEHDH